MLWVRVCGQPSARPIELWRRHFVRSAQRFGYGALCSVALYVFNLHLLVPCRCADNAQPTLGVKICWPLRCYNCGDLVMYGVVSTCCLPCFFFFMLGQTCRTACDDPPKPEEAEEEAVVPKPVSPSADRAAPPSAAPAPAPAQPAVVAPSTPPLSASATPQLSATPPTATAAPQIVSTIAPAVDPVRFL